MNEIPLMPQNRVRFPPVGPSLFGQRFAENGDWKLLGDAFFALILEIVVGVGTISGAEIVSVAPS